MLALLIASELIARKVEPRLTGRIYSQTLTGGYPIDMNAQGFRGDSVAIPKPAGVTRILALGDSVTFGTGVAWQSTWAAQLEQLLTTPDHRVEVINTGLPALDLGQIQLEIETRWKKFDADRAVLVVTGNMISFAYARRNREEIKLKSPKARNQTPEIMSPSPKDKLVACYYSFALPGVLTMGMEHLKFFVGLENHMLDPEFPTGVMLAHGYTQNEIDDDIIHESWAIFTSQLSSLVETTNQLGIELTVVYSPPRFTLSDKRIDNLKWVDKDRLTLDPVARTKAICSKLGVRFIDPSPALIDAPTPLYVLSDYTHYDRSGHRAIAQSIATASIKNP